MKVLAFSALSSVVLSIALSQEDSIFHTKALRYGPAKTAFHSVASLALLICLSLSALAALRAVGMPYLSKPAKIRLTVTEKSLTVDYEQIIIQIKLPGNIRICDNWDD